MTPEEIKQIMHAVLDERHTMGESVHREHHQFITNLLEERRIRRERIESIRRHTIGWGIITSISGIGYSVYLAIKHLFSQQ